MIEKIKNKDKERRRQQLQKQKARNKNKLGSSLELSEDQSDVDNVLQNTNVKHVVREFSESVKESLDSRKKMKEY